MATLRGRTCMTFGSAQLCGVAALAFVPVPHPQTFRSSDVCYNHGNSLRSNDRTSSSRRRRVRRRSRSRSSSSSNASDSGCRNKQNRCTNVSSGSNPTPSSPKTFSHYSHKKIRDPETAAIYWKPSGLSVAAGRDQKRRFFGLTVREFYRLVRAPGF